MYASHDVDAPLLSRTNAANHLRRSRRILRRTPPTLRGATRLLRHVSGRRMMLREPSVRVREVAAEELEERQSGWAYSKPIVVLDVAWNSAIVTIAVCVLRMSMEERPSVPLRFWIAGYASQCVVHMICVFVEYWRRCHEGRELGSGDGVGWRSTGDYLDSSSGSDGGESEDIYEMEHPRNDEETSVSKVMESANTMFSFIWWMIGFYWVTSGGQPLTDNAPQLYWLCITFLAFDMVFVVICIAVACLIGIAVCCCLPCIIAILYVVTDQEGATKEEIDQLPKYKFHKIDDVEKVNGGDVHESFGGVMTECDIDAPVQRVLSQEDTECCICLSAYDDGTELRELPCHHHFHCLCIDKWLYINATCPLCKLNILKTGNQNSVRV